MQVKVAIRYWDCRRDRDRQQRSPRCDQNRIASRIVCFEHPFRDRAPKAVRSAGCSIDIRSRHPKHVRGRSIGACHADPKLALEGAEVVAPPMYCDQPVVAADDEIEMASSYRRVHGLRRAPLPERQPLTCRASPWAEPSPCGGCHRHAPATPSAARPRQMRGRAGGRAARRRPRLASSRNARAHPGCRLA